MKRKRLTPLLLTGALTLALATPAAWAAETDLAARQQSADQAAAYAAQYGGATSVQYALWEDGEITLSGQTGVFSKTENRLLTDDDLYGIGSVSKVYTTAAVMLLVQEGKIDLDEPVTTYLPDFTMADERYQQITVRMLLNHSSGLMGGSTRDAFLFADPDNRASTEDLLERLSTQRLKADPGAYSVYCNDGFTLAELVVEAVSGLSFTDFLHTYLTDPAGLDDTFTPVDDVDFDRLARVYQTADSTTALPADTVGIIGTGGIYATASDLATFGGLFTEADLLTQTSLDAMASPEYQNGLWPEDSEDDVLAYGLGWDNVNLYPFNQNGIQALAKGGDTLQYHAGLVVLPEYDMAVAVLSSGGVSTNNELAGARILMDALAARGITVEEPGALPDAQPAAMPAELTQASGVYGSTTSVMVADIAADGTLTLSVPALLGGGSQTLTYYSDGSFRDESNSFLIRFVEEDNGNTYLFQKAYTTLPGLPATCTAEYTHQKLEENQVSDEVLAAWEARSQKLYLLLDEAWSAQSWLSAMPATTAAIPEETPGYIVSNRIVDADTALCEVQIPGTGGRDSADVVFGQENGLEVIYIKDYRYIESAYAEVISPWRTSYCTIQSSGDARWYQAGSAAGKTMSVTLEGDGSFTVYDATGVEVASSLTGSSSVVLPENGWIVFAGDTGTRFHITMDAA